MHNTREITENMKQTSPSLLDPAASPNSLLIDFCEVLIVVLLTHCSLSHTITCLRHFVSLLLLFRLSLFLALW